MSEIKKAVFRASLVKEGADLYRATYRNDLNPTSPEGTQDDHPDRTWLDSHIGTDPEAVKSWVESLAHNKGFESVSWET